MTERIETERLADGRLRVTFDEQAEAALLTMAGLACDLVTPAPAEERTDAKLAWLRDRAEQAQSFIEQVIFPPPTRDQLTVDQLDAEIDRAMGAGEDFPEVWLPTGDGAGRWWPVCAASTRKTSPHAFLHVLNDDGVGLAKQVRKADLLTVRRSTSTEGRAA